MFTAAKNIDENRRSVANEKLVNRPDRDAGVVDGVEPEIPEVRHQAVAQVDVEGRRRSLRRACTPDRCRNKKSPPILAIAYEPN